MKIENTEWKPPATKRHGRKASESCEALKSLKVGDIKRLEHTDISCKYPLKSCSLTSTIRRLRNNGMVLEYYHEAKNILVVRRLK